MNIPLISVVIPMYNRSKTIIDCLDSVCKQSYTNIEVLVVDDCSQDNSIQMVKDYFDNRVRLIQLAYNSGAQVARNRGICEATGNWIAFHDSDDIWDLKKLEKQYEILKENNFNENLVIHSNCYCYNVSTGAQEIWKVPKTENDCFSLLLKRPAPLFPSILTSKKVLIKIELLDEQVPSYQEWDTSIRLSKECRFIHIDAPLFTYIFHEGDSISKNKIRDIEGYWYIVDKYKKEMIEEGVYQGHITNLIFRSLDFYLFSFSRKFIDFKNKRGVRLLLLKALVKYKVKNKFLLKFIKRIIE